MKRFWKTDTREDDIYTQEQAKESVKLAKQYKEMEANFGPTLSEKLRPIQENLRKAENELSLGFSTRDFALIEQAKNAKQEYTNQAHYAKTLLSREVEEVRDKLIALTLPVIAKFVNESRTRVVELHSQVVEKPEKVDKDILTDLQTFYISTNLPSTVAVVEKIEACVAKVQKMELEPIPAIVKEIEAMQETLTPIFSEVIKVSGEEYNEAAKNRSRITEGGPTESMHYFQALAAADHRLMLDRINKMKIGMEKLKK